MRIEQVLEQKEQQVAIYRRDLFAESEDPDWKKNHPTGPVHIQIACQLCGEVLAKDLREYGWLKNDSFFQTHLRAHLSKHQ